MLMWRPLNPENSCKSRAEYLYIDKCSKFEMGGPRETLRSIDYCAYT